MSTHGSSGNQGDPNEPAARQRAGIQRRLRAIAALPAFQKVPAATQADIKRLAFDNDAPTPTYLEEASKLLQEPSVSRLLPAVLTPGVGNRGRDPITSSTIRGRMPDVISWSCPENDCHHSVNGTRTAPFHHAYCPKHPSRRLEPSPTP